MLEISKILFVAAVFNWFGVALVCSDTNQPHIGFLYPAGGQRGHEVYVTVGGQYLQQPQAAYISGLGVHAEIVKYYKPLGNLQSEHRQYILDLLNEARKGGMPSDSSKDISTDSAFGTLKEPKKQIETKEFKIPEHPLLFDLESRSLRQLAHIEKVLLRPRNKLQPNRQIAESILLKIKIDADAQPGVRELRITTALGLTNPIMLEVGTLPEFAEMEPNDEQPYPLKIPGLADLPKEKPLELPIIVNGQILPGDVDKFHFHAQAGQSLVIETHARRLIPFLADAVPGWFQAVVALYDAGGNEVAFEDDYLFDPDPVFNFKVPKTGEYEMTIRDSVYRGREDFVYRVSLGQLPFITRMFPLGGKEGQPLTAAIEGWNLPVNQLTLDTASSSQQVRQACYQQDGTFSNTVSYAVDSLPQDKDKESNNSPKTAQSVKLPIIIDGMIDAVGDVDMFAFQAKAGDQISAQIAARRLNSPLDSLLRLMDRSGKVLAWNDDYVIKDKAYLFKDTAGLLTHQADSCLTAKLPADGTYYLQLADSQNQGGPAFSYRLQVSANAPDFALWVTPSGLTVPAGGVVPFTIHVLSQKGFSGDIEIDLKDAPDGFKIEGGLVPAGTDCIRMTIRAPRDVPGDFISLNLQGCAKINDQVVTKPVAAADDTMQAFLYRHLVPCEQLSVALLKPKLNLPLVERRESGPVEIPAGGFALVELHSQIRPAAPVELVIQNPPEGISVQDVKVLPQKLIFTLKAEKTAKPGFADNLIILAARQSPAPGNNVKPAARPMQNNLPIIPAIPIRITAPLSDVKS